MLDDQTRLAGKKHEGGWYPLYSAVLSGNVKLVKLMLSKPKVGVNAVYNPTSEEHKAISSVDRQCELGTRVDDANGATPLHCARMTGNIDIIQLLVENGAFFRAKDDKQRKLVDYFDIRGQSESVAACREMYVKWKKRDESFKEYSDFSDPVQLIRKDKYEAFERYGDYSGFLWAHSVRNIVVRSPGPSSAVDTWVQPEDEDTRARVVPNWSYH